MNVQVENQVGGIRGFVRLTFEHTPFLNDVLFKGTCWTLLESSDWSSEAASDQRLFKIHQASLARVICSWWKAKTDSVFFISCAFGRQQCGFPSPANLDPLWCPCCCSRTQFAAWPCKLQSHLQHTATVATHTASLLEVNVRSMEWKWLRQE